MLCARTVGISRSPQIRRVGKFIVLAFKSIVGRTSMLTEWFARVAMGWAVEISNGQCGDVLQKEEVPSSRAASQLPHSGS